MVVVVLLLSGALRSITALVLGFAGLAVACAAAWWFLANRGVLRWLALTVLVAAPVFVIVVYVVAGLLWEIALSVVLSAVAVIAGRTALSSGRSPARPPEHAAAPQQRPFVIMNPRSGGGKVAKFGLADKAGTQALVAGIAAGRQIPMMVISAGTRNHFALDLGLDRDDPSTCLDALTDGVELRIDAPVALSLIGAGLGRPAVAFVGWFGPRGLASVVFALLALEDIGKVAGPAISVIALTVLLSVVAHGLTADPLARRYGPRLDIAADGPDDPETPQLPERRLIRRAS